ncbi:MAG: PhnE/PtxC family ABC transporter permease, partial [Longimicrobiales bacterium]
MAEHAKGSGLEWVWLTPAHRRGRTVALLVAAVCLSWGWSHIAARTTWGFVLDAGVQLQDMGLRMFPPDSTYLVQLARPLVDTLHIATLGTGLGVLIAIPLAFLAARTTTPSRRILRPVALLVLVTSRSVNSIIWALILVVLV